MMYLQTLRKIGLKLFKKQRKELQKKKKVLQKGTLLTAVHEVKVSITRFKELYLIPKYSNLEIKKSYIFYSNIEYMAVNTDFVIFSKNKAKNESWHKDTSFSGFNYKLPNGNIILVPLRSTG